MFKSFIIGFILTLSGCAQGDNWQVKATVTEPIEDKCSQVVFGENTCARSEKQADKANAASLVHKTTGLEDPLDMVSYVGVNVGLSW